MLLRNKIESDNAILSLGLNYVPFVNVYNIQEAIAAINIINEPIGIRSKNISGDPLMSFDTKDEALEFVKDQSIFQFPYSIYENIKAIDKDLIYQGEIQLYKDGTMCGIYCSVPSITNRVACLHSSAIHFGVPYNSRLPYKEVYWGSIPKLQPIVQYCCGNDLIGMVVEYSLFKVELGIKRENIVIWELRNY